jgi:hypothetical protein
MTPEASASPRSDADGGSLACWLEEGDLIPGSTSVLVGAAICGPHYGENEAALRSMLGNASFSG